LLSTMPTIETHPELQHRPDPWGKPTAVEVRISVRTWKMHAEPSGERIQLGGHIMLLWKDPRILDLNLCKIRGLAPQHIWRPRLGSLQYATKLTADGVTVHNFDRAELQVIFKFDISDDADHHLPNSDRLKTFPFDGIRYNYFESMSDEIFMHTTNEIDANFHINGQDHIRSEDPSRRNRPNSVTWVTGITSGEHRLRALSYAIGTHSSMDTGNTYVDITFSLHIDRDITYYVNKVFTPLVVIFAYGLLAYTFPPFELEARLMLLATMYLTVFAIQWTCHDRLPRTPHATVVDEVVWNIMMALLAIAIGSCVSFRLALADGDTEEDYDIGWTSSRASRSDLAFMLLSIVTGLLRGGHVKRRIRRIQKDNGSMVGFRRNGGVGLMRAFNPTKGRVFRYYPATATHTAVEDPNDF